jgi:glycosyltransferase involved in cell wall biosynthesis
MLSGVWAEGALAEIEFGFITRDNWVSLMKTCVLLSTYNGELFIQDQIESILRQTILPDYLIVRDDGSSDRTIEIIQSDIKGSEISLQIIIGENIGPAKSFMELFHLGVATDADVFFFCDQDDIWEQEKISVFVSRFNCSPQVPRAVFSQLLLVDEANKPILLTIPPRKIGFGNSIIENVMTGCALACNRPLLKLVSERSFDDSPLHDSLIYIISTMLGTVEYIDTPLTRYRQHGKNVIGYSTSTWRSCKSMFVRTWRGKNYKKSTLAQNILSSYGDIMQLPDRRTLEMVARCPQSMILRIKLALSTRLWRQNTFHGVTWRALCVFGFF